METEWISVEDKPLFIPYNKELGEEYWQVTDDGQNEFIAAVPIINNGIQDWWIHHCVIEDEIGLVVIGDTDNEPAGFGIEDITHWMPLPNPPKL